MRALMGEAPHGRAKQAKGVKVSDALLDKMERMGWAAKQLAGLRARAAPEPAAPTVIEVEPELWDAFRVFRLVHDSQWRRQTLDTAKGFVTVRQSLDFGAVAAVAKDIGVGGSESFWDQIGAFEAEALALYRLREQRAAQGR